MILVKMYFTCKMLTLNNIKLYYYVGREYTYFTNQNASIYPNYLFKIYVYIHTRSQTHTWYMFSPIEHVID